MVLLLFFVCDELFLLVPFLCQKVFEGADFVAVDNWFYFSTTLTPKTFVLN
jgi:hypothetical protein